MNILKCKNAKLSVTMFKIIILLFLLKNSWKKLFFTSMNHFKSRCYDLCVIFNRFRKIQIFLSKIVLLDDYFRQRLTPECVCKMLVQITNIFDAESNFGKQKGLKVLTNSLCRFEFHSDIFLRELGDEVGLFPKTLFQ